MKAMILAAGLGTRLRPLTDKLPKALIPVVNRPVMERVIEYLTSQGVGEIVVNAHHHYRQILDYVDGGRPFGIRMEVSVEPEILGTGGGIKNVSDFWDEGPLIVINGDVLTDINLDRALEHHRRSGRIATLILHDHEPFNKISTDLQGNIADIPLAYGSRGLAFTGIHIIEPELVDFIPEGGYSDITDCYRGLILSGTPVSAHISEGHYWHDIGSPEGYLSASRELAKGPFTLGPGCRIAPSAGLEEWAVIGADCDIAEGARIRGSILWEGARIGPGVRVVDSVVTTSQEVTRDLKGEIC